MMPDSQTIMQLEQQILMLTEELTRLRKNSTSMWNIIYNAFIDEGNDNEIATLWADRISEIITNWVNNQRNQLGQKVVSSGEMPPYTDCLNDLIVSLTPLGSQPSIPIANISLEHGPESPPPPPPVVNNISLDAQAGPPKMQRVNVPKPFKDI